MGSNAMEYLLPPVLQSWPTSWLSLLRPRLADPGFGTTRNTAAAATRGVEHAGCHGCQWHQWCSPMALPWWQSSSPKTALHPSARSEGMPAASHSTKVKTVGVGLPICPGNCWELCSGKTTLLAQYISSKNGLENNCFAAWSDSTFPHWWISINPLIHSIEIWPLHAAGGSVCWSNSLLYGWNP